MICFVKVQSLLHLETHHRPPLLDLTELSLLIQLYDILRNSDPSWNICYRWLLERGNPSQYLEADLLALQWIVVFSPSHFDLLL